MEIPIENKCQPRIPERDAEVQEPAKNRHESSSISNYEQCREHTLNAQEHLLIWQRARVAVDANRSVYWIDLGTQKAHGEGALFAVKGMEIIEAKCQFRKEKRPKSDPINSQRLDWGTQSGAETGPSAHSAGIWYFSPFASKGSCHRDAIWLVAMSIFLSPKVRIG